MKWRSLQESGSPSDHRFLREILAERKQNIAQYVPADVQAVHMRTVEFLRSQRIVDLALQVGATAPHFELTSHSGQRVSSVELLKRSMLVVSFIRGRWCPFCVGQMEAMSLVAPQIANAGAQVLAISPQTEKQAFFMNDQHKLNFPLLVDAHNDVARSFGLVYRVPEEQQKLYRSTFVNLPHANGDDSWELPIPATYIIGGDGKILFASVDVDYTSRPEPLEILSFVESIS